MKLLKLDLFDGLLKMGRSELKSVDAIHKDLFQEMLKVDIGRMKRDLQDIVNKRTEEEEELKVAKEKQEGLVEQRDGCMRRIKKCKHFSEQTVASLEIDEDKLNNRLENLEERSVKIREELEQAEKSLQSVGYSQEKEVELAERAERLEKDNQKKENMLRVKIKKLMRTRKPVPKSFQGKSMTFLKKKLKKLKRSLVDLDNEEEVVKRFNQFKRYDRTLRDREGELERVVRMRKDMESKLEKLSKHQYDPNCEFCVNNIFVKDAIKTKKELDSVLEQEKELDVKVESFMNKVEDLKDAVELHTRFWDNLEHNKLVNDQIEDIKAAIYNIDVDEKIGDLEEELEKVYDTVDEEYEQYMSKKKDYEKAELKVKDLTIKKFNCEAKITSVEKELEKVEKKLEKAYKYKKVAEKNKKVEQELNKVEKSLKEITTVVDRLSQSLTTTHTHVALLKNDMKNYNEKQKKLASLTERKKILTTYTNMVERNGLPYSLLTTIIPRIEITVNQILMPFNDFGVTIKLQKNGLVKVFKSFNSVERDAELCSTSEKFLIGTAIRVALTQMSNLSSCNFMVFDEGFSCLDGENSNNIECLFDYLRNKFDFVIIVSHLQQMRTMCDNILNIDTSGKFSRIRY